MGTNAPTTEQDERYREAVVELLKRVCEQYGLDTDDKLADALGRNRTTALRYRTGAIRQQLAPLLHLETTLEGFTLPAEIRRLHDAAAKPTPKPIAPVAFNPPEQVPSVRPRDLPPIPIIVHDRIRRTVPVVGYVGAGAQAHFYATGDGELDRVDAPDYATESTVAASIRGESLGPLLEHFLVFWDDVRSPVTEDLFHQLCVVGLPDDRILVKKIKPTSTPGRFDLLSNTEGTMEDQEVMWAAKVKGMQPR